MNMILTVLLMTSAHAADLPPEPAAEDLGVVMAAPTGHRKTSRQAPSPAPRSEVPLSTAAAVVPIAPETRACPGPGVQFLPTGFIFSALLPDAIYSYNVAVPIVALIEDDVKFGGHLVLPRGTHLVGNASTLY